MYTHVDRPPTLYSENQKTTLQLPEELRKLWKRQVGDAKFVSTSAHTGRKNRNDANGKRQNHTHLHMACDVEKHQMRNTRNCSHVLLSDPPLQDVG